MGAEYLSYVKSIATFAPTFYGYIISVLASVPLLTQEYPTFTYIAQNSGISDFWVIGGPHL